VRHGHAGPAGQRLDQAGLACQLLHDAVEIDEDARGLFEPLLTPFTGALCVAPADAAAALTAVADLPGTLLASTDAPLPAGVTAAPPGAGGLLAWVAAEGHTHDGAAELPGRVTVVGGFDTPTIGHAARQAAAHAAWAAAAAAADTAGRQAEAADRHLARLADELAAAHAEQRRRELAAQRDRLLIEAGTLTETLAPLDDALEHADAAHRDAQAAQRGLTDRRTEVTAHLKTCREQLGVHKRTLADITAAAGRVLLTSWIGHLDTCRPTPSATLADRFTGHSPLELSADLTDATRDRLRDVVATHSGSSHRDILTRLETDLGVTVTVTVARTEQTRAVIHGGDLDPVTHAALVAYHEQAAAVDRRRARDSEEREVAALDTAIAALRSAGQLQADKMRAALTRAQEHHQRLQREYDASEDEVHATEANLRNIQRGPGTPGARAVHMRKRRARVSEESRLATLLADLQPSGTPVSGTVPRRAAG